MALMKLAAAAALAAFATPGAAFDVREAGASTLFYISIPLDFGLSRKEQQWSAGLQLQGKRAYQAVTIDSSVLNFVSERRRGRQVDRRRPRRRGRRSRHRPQGQGDEPDAAAAADPDRAAKGRHVHPPAGRPLRPVKVWRGLARLGRGRRSAHPRDRRGDPARHRPGVPADGDRHGDRCAQHPARPRGRPAPGARRAAAGAAGGGAALRPRRSSASSPGASGSCTTPSWRPSSRGSSSAS